MATVIDLRSPRELAVDAPSALEGAAYVNIPLVDDLSLRDIGDTADMLERYLSILDGRPEAFRDVFFAVAEANGGVLFHCFAGKDRTGLIAAMALSLAGVDEMEIAADFAETDRRLAKRYEAWIASAPPEKREAMRAELSCPPERILGVLDHLERGWGGVAGYLEAGGLDAARIDLVARRLT